MRLLQCNWYKRCIAASFLMLFTLSMSLRLLHEHEESACEHDSETAQFVMPDSYHPDCSVCDSLLSPFLVLDLSYDCGLPRIHSFFFVAKTKRACTSFVNTFYLRAPPTL